MSDRTPENVAFTVPSGPLIVTGDLQIHTGADEPVSQPRASLCRCGHSSKKPFCDGSHRTSGFADPGTALPEENILELIATGPVVFMPLPAGPLLATGPLTVQNAAKETILCTTDTAFCRCGASQNKPYCDGSHAAIGFLG